MAQPFDHLLGARWRTTSFPFTKMRISIAHDLAEHKYWGVDGARVEATGLAPIRFMFSIPMIQGIVPGKTEGWRAGSLYPTAYRLLLVDFAKKTTGVLVHPEFGEIFCKAEKLDIEYSGDRRGGVEIEASWVETIPDDSTRLNPSPLPQNEMSAAAQDIDASNADLSRFVPKLPEFPTTFEDLMASITSVFDQASMLSMRAGGQIDNVMYRLDRLSDAVDKAGDPRTIAATQSIERMRAAAVDLREKLLQANRDIILYGVPRDSTLSEIVNSLPGVEVGDLVSLNPTIVSKPIVPRYTVVRYYAPRVQ